MKLCKRVRLCYRFTWVFCFSFVFFFFAFTPSRAVSAGKLKGFSGAWQATEEQHQVNVGCHSAPTPNMYMWVFMWVQTAIVPAKVSSTAHPTAAWTVFLSENTSNIVGRREEKILKSSDNKFHLRATRLFAAVDSFRRAVYQKIVIRTNRRR